MTSSRFAALYDTLCDPNMLFLTDSVERNAPSLSPDGTPPIYSDSTTSLLLASNGVGMSAPVPFFQNSSPIAHSSHTASISGAPFTFCCTTVPPPLPSDYQERSSYAGAACSEVATGADNESSAISPPSSPSASAIQKHNSAHNASYSPRDVTRPQGTRKNARLRNLRNENDVSDKDGDVPAEKPMASGVSRSDIAQCRREELRRQRFRSEQRQRKELRDGYVRLEETLPISNIKSSKLALLDRATSYIRELKASEASLQTRLEEARKESARLTNMIDDMMSDLAGQYSMVAASTRVMSSARPLTRQ